jgi:hypothetical protein
MSIGNGDRLAARLSEAYRERYGSVLKFQKAIEAHAQKQKKEIKGDDYPSVRAYVKGIRQPRPDWLEVAAEVTGYRAEWLAFGSGERTPEDQKVADANRGKTPIELIAPEGVRISDSDAEAFRRQFKNDGALYYTLTPTLQLMFDNVYARLVKYTAREIEAGEVDFRLACANRLVETLRTGFSVEPPEGPKSLEFTDYAWSLLHTIALSLRAKVDAVVEAKTPARRR